MQPLKSPKCSDREELDQACSVLMRHMHNDFTSEEVKRSIGIVCGFIGDVRHSIHALELLLQAARVLEEEEKSGPH